MIAIYKITNTTNGKFYIGSSGNYRKRLQKWRDWRNCCHNPALYNEFETIGYDKFKFEVIQELPPDTTKRERERIEYDLIHRLQPHYNTIGKQRPPDVIEKLRKASIGRVQTQEEKDKRAASIRTRFSIVPRSGASWFKPVFVVETGETFESVKAAAKWIGVDVCYLSRAMKHHPDRKVKGYHFKYLPKCRD